MITTRRSEGYGVKSGTAHGVDVLERTSAYNEAASTREESVEETRARMQRNFKNLLNYDRYSEMEAEREEEKERQAKTTVAYADEDIRPTTTTTQFIDGDPQIFNEANQTKEEHKSAYRLNGKGKLVLVLYALVVTVILALIVLNTGIIKALSGQIEALETSYAAHIAEVEAQNSVIAEMSSDAHIIDVAENEYNMILG